KTLRALPPAESRRVIGQLAQALGQDYPAEVRILAAEALARLDFPIIEPALKPLLRAVRSDPDQRVRHRAIWCFLHADLKTLDGGVEALTAALNDRATRYDAARALARALQRDAPKKVIDVLEAMLNDPTVKVYLGANADVRGGSESAGGQSAVREALGG